MKSGNCHGPEVGALALDTAARRAVWNLKKGALSDALLNADLLQVTGG
jgi:hypothetical protein